MPSSNILVKNCEAGLSNIVVYNCLQSWELHCDTTETSPFFANLKSKQKLKANILHLAIKCPFL